MGIARFYRFYGCYTSNKGFVLYVWRNWLAVSHRMSREHHLAGSCTITKKVSAETG